MDVPDEGLLAVVDHLHGPARPQRQQRGVDLYREVLAPAESAADTGEVDPHLLGLEIEARRDLVAIDVKPLRRDVDVDSALAVRDRDPRLGTEEGLILLADLVDAFDGDVPLGIRVAAPDHHRADDVGARVVAVPVSHRRPIGVERLHLGRALGIGDGLERLVLDANRRSGAACLLGLLGRDDRDRLAEVADAVEGEHGLVGELEAVGLAAGDVVLGDDRVDARHRDRLGDVDLEDPRVRVRAADGLAPEHPGGAEVARVRELARDLGDRIGTARGRNRPTATERAGRRAHPPAARWTASRIFWYPVQRQRLPESASRISSSVGSGTRRRRSAAATTKPGVQNPH